MNGYIFEDLFSWLADRCMKTLKRGMLYKNKIMINLLPHPLHLQLPQLLPLVHPLTGRRDLFLVWYPNRYPIEMNKRVI